MHWNKLILLYCFLLFSFSAYATNISKDTLNIRTSFSFEGTLGYGVAENSGPYMAFSGLLSRKKLTYQVLLSFFRYDYFGENISNHNFLGSMNNLSFLLGYTLIDERKILFQPFVGLFVGKGRIKYSEIDIENYSYYNLNNLITVNHEVNKVTYLNESIGGVNIKLSTSYRLSEKIYSSSNISTILYNIGNKNFLYNVFLSFSLRYNLK